MSDSCTGRYSRAPASALFGSLCVQRAASGTCRSGLLCYVMRALLSRRPRPRWVGPRHGCGGAGSIRYACGLDINEQTEKEWDRETGLATVGAADQGEGSVIGKSERLPAAAYEAGPTRRVPQDQHALRGSLPERHTSRLGGRRTREANPLGWRAGLTSAQNVEMEVGIRKNGMLVS